MSNKNIDILKLNSHEFCYQLSDPVSQHKLAEQTTFCYISKQNLCDKQNMQNMTKTRVHSHKMLTSFLQQKFKPKRHKKENASLQLQAFTLHFIPTKKQKNP
jgi:hypothetical protein